MHDLLHFKEMRIEALLEEVKQQELEIERLRTYIFELCDKDCPNDYKRVIVKDVFESE